MWHKLCLRTMDDLVDLISCMVGDVSDRRNRRAALAFAGSILAMSAGAELLTVSDGGGEEVLATRFVAAIFVGPLADGAPARRPGAPPRQGTPNNSDVRSSSEVAQWRGKL